MAKRVIMFFKTEEAGSGGRGRSLFIELAGSRPQTHSEKGEPVPHSSARAVLVGD